MFETAARAAIRAGGALDPVELVLMAAVVLAVVVILVWIAVAIRTRQIVDGASVALRRLAELNTTYDAQTRAQSPIRLSFVESLNSKSKLDRFDLDSFMRRSVMEREQWVESEVRSRTTAIKNHHRYEQEFDRLAREALGTSSHERIEHDRFVKTESRLFTRRKLKYPTPAAHVRAIVTYTSPKGQNSYSRSLEWGFGQLQAGLRAAQDERAQQSTTQFLRQRERAIMTDRMRMQILRRDDFRCRMCGASGRNGAELHVDHILPVSMGGRSIPENLQALCKPCNLGKSNTFVG